jgi:hypothetical protein
LSRVKTFHTEIDILSLPFSLGGFLAIQRAKLRISEQNTKEKIVFLWIFDCNATLCTFRSEDESNFTKGES